MLPDAKMNNKGRCSWLNVHREVSSEYLSSGGAQERYRVPHFHSHSHSSHVPLTNKWGSRCQGDLSLAGQWGGQELGSTLVPLSHVCLMGQKNSDVNTRHLRPCPFSSRRRTRSPNSCRCRALQTWRSKASTQRTFPQRGRCCCNRHLLSSPASC